MTKVELALARFQLDMTMPGLTDLLITTNHSVTGVSFTAWIVYFHIYRTMDNFDYGNGT